ncbi:hypothetical protein WJR50_30820 [Catalinimonas sp. 4WD22]|uniref:hypothetical protein n=1 Tax=Catalinimonas locisalis TaxID=3133978 RepID=UPI0031012425
MNSILIQPANKKDLELIKTLLKKMKFPYKELTDEEKKELGLLKAMSETNDDEKVPLENIMKFLDS